MRAAERDLQGRIFYVYCYFIEDIPRYVGKGCGARDREHLAEARKDAPCTYWHQRLREAIDAGLDIRVERLHVDLTETEAHALENACLRRFGLASLVGSRRRRMSFTEILTGRIRRGSKPVGTLWNTLPTNGRDVSANPTLAQAPTDAGAKKTARAKADVNKPGG